MSRTGRPPAGDERASTFLGTLMGVGAVVVCVAFAANVCLGLWTRSTVEAVAQDAARDLAATAGGTIDAARVHEVLARARSQLGPTGDRTRLDVERIDDDVTLRVRHPGVSLLPRLLHRGTAVGAIDERIVVRREGVA